MRAAYFLLFFVLYFFSFPVLALATPIPPVIVIAKKIETDSLTQAPKIRITQQEMSAAGMTSIEQALQDIAGIQIHDPTGNNSQPSISLRGFGGNASSNTLILVNGIPLTNPDMMPPDLNTIPIQEIKYIEIISGSESVLYGDQAVGGIINIVTQPGSSHKIDLSCAGGTYDQHNCYAAFNNHLQNLKYTIGLLNQHSNNYRVHNNYDQNLLSGELHYPYQTGKLAFDYRIANEYMQYPGALSSTQVAQNRRQALNDTDFFKDWNGFYHLRWLQRINTSWYTTTDFARREMHGNGVISSFNVPYLFDQSRTIYFISPKLQGVIGKSLITSGIDFQTDSYNFLLLGKTKDTQQTYGIFGLFNYPLTPGLIFSAGARIAQQNNQLLQPGNTLNTINRAVATTLGVSYQLFPQLKLYLRRAGSFRFPKADEDTFTSQPNGLRTQTGVSYETGIKLNYDNSKTRFSLYQLNLDNEIAFNPLQPPPFGSNSNYPPTVRRGFSLSEKYCLTQKLILGGQYNYVRARFNSGINAGKQIPLVSENIILANLNYKMAQHWNFYAEALYTGSQFAANDDANVSGQMGGYTTYNFNLRYKLKNLSLSFRANNIFNKYYYLYTSYRNSTQNLFYYPSAGRNFLVTFKYFLD